MLNRPLIRLAVPVLLATAAVASGAQAFEITPEQRDACMGDALRLCGSEIPDLARVLTCMKAKRSQVSAHCKATIPRAMIRSL